MNKHSNSHNLEEDKKEELKESPSDKVIETFLDNVLVEVKIIQTDDGGNSARKLKLLRNLKEIPR